MSRKADERIDEAKPRMANPRLPISLFKPVSLIIQIQASEPLYTDYLRPHCLLG